MIRLAVRVPRHAAELALADLLELAPAGVEEVDLSDEIVEYAIYGAAGEVPELGDLRAVVGAAVVDVSSRVVADDWAERWKRFHRPVIASGREGRISVRVRPPWESAVQAREQEALDVVIDPGQAFGTGAHASTRLCLELLADLAEGGHARGPLCDIGCGSGVLAIAAARLGWAPVQALDHELESVAAARTNASANAIALDVRRADLRHDPLAGARTVTANLLAPLLIELSRRRPAVAPTRLVAGGLLTAQADEVSAALRGGWGLRERARRVDGDWAALLLDA